MTIYIDKTKLELAFHGESNWDYYASDTDRLYAIAKQGHKYRGCQDTGFGDKNHIRYLLNNHSFHGIPTDRGLQIMSGLAQTITGGHWHYFA